MSKVKENSLKVIIRFLVWMSSSVVIFILLLLLIVACQPTQQHAQKGPIENDEDFEVVPAPSTQQEDYTDPNEPPADLDFEMDIEIEEETQIEEMVFEGAPQEEHIFLHVEPETKIQEFNTEEYDRIYENEFQQVWQQPISTFSIDVDQASYSNTRRFITQFHQLPPKDVVRIEEMINYFQYDYPQPEGEHPFSIYTELGSCPWNVENQLLHIGIQGKTLDYENLKPSNLVLLLDVSGSMDEPNKLPLVKRSLHLLLDALGVQDKISIVVYAGASGLVLPATPAYQKDKILKAIDHLEAGGSTAGGEGIALAYHIAEKNLIPKGNNRVILATDGDFNVGTSSTSELVRMIEKKRKSGIYLTICGFGMGNYKDGRMEQISNAGNGNYFYIDNIKEAQKVFVREMRANLFTIAKDVKIQLEFNPTQVKAYRLIGYENRSLAREDFDNDLKDAGELGAGHTVTALYEIVPASLDEKATVDASLRYQQSQTTTLANSKELLSFKLRYKPIDSDKSQLITQLVIQEQYPGVPSYNFRFANAVAGFGMLLRDSQYKGSLTYDEVIQMVEGTMHSKDEEKREFVQLVKAASLLDQ
ncbi:VWA domain-containing protein [Catalinimonas sp. 4WD22]|uniref:vWA domain-containing protein n=1 Tax=Catalinimonas locisalis TaxID=3133978 RepID=UPI00310101E6